MPIFSFNDNNQWMCFITRAPTRMQKMQQLAITLQWLQAGLTVK
jgi:hypothetical protein